MANRIREFNIALSGDGIVSGGFGKIPTQDVTLDHLRKSFNEFKIVGDQGIHASGSLEKGYVLSGQNTTGEEVSDLPPTS